MAKLSEAMHRHLSSVCIQPGRSAYPGLRLATLEALEARGLVRRVAERGHIFNPANCIRWFPTGKAAGPICLRTPAPSPTAREGRAVGEVRGKTAVYKCARCGDPFKARTADRARGWARFCSKSCKAIRQTQKTGYRGPNARRDERDGFVMNPADLAMGGYGDAGPDDSFGDGKW